MQTATGKIELIIDTASFPTKGKSLSRSKLDFVSKLKADGIKLQVSEEIRWIHSENYKLIPDLKSQSITEPRDVDRLIGELVGPILISIVLVD